MNKIFLSYRRADSTWQTELLHKELKRIFGKEACFLDRHDIRGGEKFRQEIEEAVCQSKVMLVIIGPNWVGNFDRCGHQNEDWVRFEIETALKLKVNIIPILFEPATLPSEHQLPSTLKELSFIQTITIRPGKEFKASVKELVNAVTNQLAGGNQYKRLLHAKWFKKTSWVFCVSVVILGIAITTILGSINEKKDLAKAFSESAEAWCKSKFAILENALKAPAFSTNDRVQLRKALDELSRSNDFPGGVYALDGRGILEAQSTPNSPDMLNLVGQPFNHREYYTEMRRQNRTLITNAFTSGQRQVNVVVVSSPRRNSKGDFIGILNGVIDVATSEFSEIADTVSDLRTNRGIDIFLIDSKGHIISSNVKSEIDKTFKDVGLFKRFVDDSAGLGDILKAAYRRVGNTPFHVIAIDK